MTITGNIFTERITMQFGYLAAGNVRISNITLSYASEVSEF